MKIGFLIIASEVLDGKISDQNTKNLAEFLRIHSLEINKAQVVRDEKEDIIKALKELYETNELVITSGGLGPTKDDITKETIASFFNKKIELNEMSIRIAEGNYIRFGRTFPGREHGYSFLPSGCTPLSNRTGFAPGFYGEFNKRYMFCAPGVPREFKSMLEDHLLDAFKESLSHKMHIQHFVARTKYIPEEKIFGEVDTTLWSKLEKLGQVSSLPILMGVDIGVKVKANSDRDLTQMLSQVESIFKNSPIYKNIWNFGPDTLEEKILEVAKRKNIKFGFAESATGGLCSHRITSVPGSSQCFMGSVVCYDEKIKSAILDVKQETMNTFDIVSNEVASEMAEGLLRKFDLDIAISITGLAGPSGGTVERPVGTVCIGRSIKGKSSSETLQLKGDRDVLKQRFSQAALFALLEELERFS